MVYQQQFLDFLAKIEPSSTTVSSCASAHATLRKRLEQDSDFKKKHVFSFLSGSYMRDTAIRPQTKNGVISRPDVDIIVVTNYKKTDYPMTAMLALYKVLIQYYEPVVCNRRSMSVSLSSVDMDIVPVIPDLGSYLIPDKTMGAWLPTDPVKHTSWAGNVNQKSSYFKPLVKLLKWWKREHLPELKRPKGFILECLVARHMTYTPANYEHAVAYLFEQLAVEYLKHFNAGTVPFLEDPAVANSNVFSNVTPEEFKLFYAAILRTTKFAIEAYREKDMRKSTTLWKTFFGPEFPS